ncbi:MAG: hypothetical protein GIX03_09990 [Candidatus Eremiobacteraeota bacterium]|nr:hypothetical protein [Candidatus Eremiobacteraeota bacterium]MBC5803300.1 hypothetical protein [Candidatus Eremiobacteraeota bacterium]MBC5822921.1 hypothetical protein [Candidatus Eremiobacteraeota bacterium]
MLALWTPAAFAARAVDDLRGHPAQRVPTLPDRWKREAPEGRLGNRGFTRVV